MVAYVIIPGIGGSDDEHWQSHWQLQWGAAAVRIEPAAWGSRLEVVGELGHLNSASALGAWPRGRELRKSLLSG